MKLFVTTAVAALFGASAAFAADAPAITELDTDGDGMVSLSEAQAHDPSISAESFAEFDADGDGYLDVSEFSVWASEASAQTTGQGDVDMGGELDTETDLQDSFGDETAPPPSFE